MAFFNHYVNMVSESSSAHTRLIRDYDELTNKDFDYIVIGSGFGGGILADELANRLGHSHRILLLDAGSFIYPTHVYNFSKIPNSSTAQHFGADNFSPWPDDTYFIGGKPQMAFGGRSVFWSGLIPQVRDWELDFFPDAVRDDLVQQFLTKAGAKMNQSVSLGIMAKNIVAHFKNSNLGDDFDVEETPRAVHQPYLKANGTLDDRFFHEPTGVFNTAELLINQVGLTSNNTNLNGKGLFIKLNTFVEGVRDIPFNWHEVKTTNTITSESLSFYAPKVIIAAGAIESPKLINRSSVYHRLPDDIKRHVGFGLTDHPVTGESQAYVSSLGNMPITRKDHAKIIFYSKGKLDAQGNIQYPFNIEMNVNHEYWHLRDNDPSAEPEPDNTAKARVDIKFSFANCLDDNNGIFSHVNDRYIPAIRFKRFSDLDDLLQSRFPAIAGWNKTHQQFFDLLNGTRNRVFNEFNGVDWLKAEYGGGDNKQWPFGWGTVHHACGTLRMPWKSHRHAGFNVESVVDENLNVKGAPGLYVCDMSVMPVSTAANPVRTLAALALRLSRHL